MSLDFGQVRDEFEGFLTSTLLGIPVEYQSVPPSVELLQAKKLKTPWARLTILEGGGFRTEIGKTPNRRWVGLVKIGLFYPRGQGSKEVRTKATTIANLILPHSFVNILIRTPEFTIIDEETTEKTTDWLMGDLTIPYELNQIT